MRGLDVWRVWPELTYSNRILSLCREMGETRGHVLVTCPRIGPDWRDMGDMYLLRVPGLWRLCETILSPSCAGVTRASMLKAMTPGGYAGQARVWRERCPGLGIIQNGARVRTWTGTHLREQDFKTWVFEAATRKNLNKPLIANN